MPKTAKPKFNEKDLTKGQFRKLAALRKSLGNKIADKAFADWLSSLPTAEVVEVDRNAELIADALQKLRETKGLRIPRGGYRVSSGRGRTIVEPLEEN